MCSIRLRKQKVSSKNAAQIGLTCADHKGHRQSRQLPSTSKAAEDRRTPRRKRRIKLAVTAIPRLRESAAVFCRFGSGQSFYGGDKVSAGYRRSAGVANRSNTAHWQFLVSGFACARLRNERRQLQQAT